jgi:hypothetical protein
MNRITKNKAKKEKAEENVITMKRWLILYIETN